MNYTFWTAEEDAILRALYDEGKSYSQIGKALNRTKCGCISRGRKLKLPPRPDLHAKRMSERTTRLRARAANPYGYSRPKRTRERKPPMIMRVVPAPDSIPVPLVDRTGCAYPTTHNGPHLFCNAPTGGNPYCSFHHNVMFRVRPQ